MEESNKQETSVHYEKRPAEKNINKKLKLIIKAIIIVSCVTAAVTIILSLVLTSLDSLKPSEMGLDYDPFNAQVNTNKLYFQGRYLLGVGHTFIKFPRQAEIIAFSNSSLLRCRTQYMLNDNVNNVVDLYNKYGENFKDALSSIAKDVAGDVLSSFQVIQLYTDRGKLSLALQNQITNSFQREHANVVSLQLLEIIISDEMRDILNLIERKNLDIQIAQNNQNSINTELLSEKLKASITVNNYQKMGDILNTTYMNKCQTKISKIQYLVKTIQGSLANMRTSLGFKSKDYISYMYIQNLNKRKSSIENIPAPKQMQCISNSSLSFCN